MPYVRFLQLISSSYSYPGMWLNTLPWYLSRLFYFVITLIFSALNGFCFSSIFLSVLLYRVWFSLQVIYAVCKVLSLLGAKTLFHYCVIYFLILSFVFILSLISLIIDMLTLIITTYRPFIPYYNCTFGLYIRLLGLNTMPWHCIILSPLTRLIPLDTLNHIWMLFLYSFNIHLGHKSTSLYITYMKHY